MIKFIFLDNTNTNNINYLNEKYSSKTLALFSLYIFCILFLIIVTYFCIKTKYRQDAIMKNVPFSSSILTNISQTFSNLRNNLSESTRHQRNRISFYLTSLCPHTLSKLRSTNGTSGNNCIYTGTNSGLNGEDDRLGLAEYQVFDQIDEDTNVYVYRNATANNNNNNIFDQFSDNDDLQTSNKNPYRSLTIKS
jgi:hypothetical protein